LVDRYPKLQTLGKRIAEGAARGRRHGILEKTAGSKAYPLPAVTDSTDELELQPVTLRALAQHAAYQPGSLTAEDLHAVRERLKKGTAVYADKEWRHVVLASRTAAAEANIGPIESASPGLVFTVLCEAAGERQALIRAMAKIAAQQGMAGLLVAGGTEPAVK
jgi:hypothetical protein